MSKNAPLSAGLIATKGAARTSVAMPEPSNDAEASAPATVKVKPPKELEVPLNFSVPASWKKRFALSALNADMKHKEFLFWLYEQYESRSRNP